MVLLQGVSGIGKTRLLQEALSNVRKHAGASSVQVYMLFPCGPLWTQAALRHLAGECAPEPTAVRRRDEEGAPHVA